MDQNVDMWSTCIAVTWPLISFLGWSRERRGSRDLWVAALFWIWTCFTNSDGPSDRATDHPPMLFVHSRMVRRPVGQSGRTLATSRAAIQTTWRDWSQSVVPDSDTLATCLRLQSSILPKFTTSLQQNLSAARETFILVQWDQIF